MKTTTNKQRIYAFWLALGACILLFRTITMVVQGALGILVFWVAGLLIIELLLDFACLLGSVTWWLKNDKKYARFPLRVGAATTLLHAMRVLIWVMGRIGPWIDFDVRPEHRVAQPIPWGWMYFASVLSVLGLLGVFIIWRARQRSKHKI